MCRVWGMPCGDKAARCAARVGYADGVYAASSGGMTDGRISVKNQSCMSMSPMWSLSFILPMVRLTVSHYYTPSGRCIQKPYGTGANYEAEVFERYASGELVSADSIEVADTTVYRTLERRRPVYGGGGIIPDLFVPIDTGVNYSYFNRLLAKGVVSEYAMNYVDRHRGELEKAYPEFEEFRKKFEVTDGMVEEIVAEGERQGVARDEALLAPVEGELRLFVKSLVARDLWGMTELYRVSNETNKILNAAVEALRDGTYEDLLD